VAYSVKILADSISPAGHRLTTFECTFPRIVLAEVNTHKMLSKNSASSRAIPVGDRIAAIRADPFVPEQFGKNRSGMQATETLDDDASADARMIWANAMHNSLANAGFLAELEVHKQLANRLLEPFAWHTAIISGTDWENFYGLRVHPAAQGEFSKFARTMKELHADTTPNPVNYGEWHAPLVLGDPELDGWNLQVGGASWRDIAHISAGRCARVSFEKHGLKEPAKDIDRAQKLISNGHLSPLEHPARPMAPWELESFKQYEFEIDDGEGRRIIRSNCNLATFVYRRDVGIYPKHLKVWGLGGKERQVHYCGNYNGWVQLRKLIPGEAVFRG